MKLMEAYYLAMEISLVKIKARMDSGLLCTFSQFHNKVVEILTPTHIRRDRSSNLKTDSISSFPPGETHVLCTH